MCCGHLQTSHQSKVVLVGLVYFHACLLFVYFCFSPAPSAFKPFLLFSVSVDVFIS